MAQVFCNSCGVTTSQTIFDEVEDWDYDMRHGRLVVYWKCDKCERINEVVTELSDDDESRES
jgi:hypothetical protein